MAKLLFAHGLDLLQGLLETGNRWKCYMSEHGLDAILLRHFLCDRIAFCIVISSLRLAEVPKSCKFDSTDGCQHGFLAP